MNYRDRCFGWDVITSALYLIFTCYLVPICFPYDLSYIKFITQAVDSIVYRDYESETKFLEFTRYGRHTRVFPFPSLVSRYLRWHSRERNSFNRGGNAIFARMPPARPTAGRSCEEMHRADYLEPRKWNTVISVSRERNPISLLRRGFVRIPRNKGRSLSLSFFGSSLFSRGGIKSKKEERQKGKTVVNFFNL